jgi:hypothetical protein
MVSTRFHTLEWCAQKFDVGAWRAKQNAMSMISRKSQSASQPFEGEDELARLTERCGELGARRRIVHETILTVEKTTASAQSDVNADKAQAEAMLNGAQFVASREKPLSRLAALYAERDAIDLALKIGESRIHVLATARAEQIWASRFAEIAEVEKRRVMLVFELQRTNRAREKLREKITKAGGSGFLATDGVEFLGFGDEYAEIQWAANRLIADGIATKAEIEKARSDG